MKLEMNSTNRAIAALVVFAALGVAFWTMLLSPKRDEARKLETQVEDLRASLAQHEAQVAEGEIAREEFPADYQRLVVLGKAIPGDDDIASLLVQLNRIANDAGGQFRNLQLSGSGGGGEETASAPPAGGEGTSISATEMEASLLPLGASIGTAGLAVMPYEVSFDGNFFEVADFIKGLDSLVETDEEGVMVDGRLLTIDSFSLDAGGEGFPALQASFSLTSYLTPPSEGVTGGATESAPSVATPAATTTTGATP